jgi:hypothetical protein
LSTAYQQMQTRMTSIGKRIPLKLSMLKRQVFGRNSLLDPGGLIVNVTEP